MCQVLSCQKHRAARKAVSSGFGKGAVLNVEVFCGKLWGRRVRKTQNSSSQGKTTFLFSLVPWHQPPLLHLCPFPSTPVPGRVNPAPTWSHKPLDRWVNSQDKAQF